MSPTEQGSDPSPSTEAACSCGPDRGCRIEAILSVDERGQMVLPKDVRQKAGIRTGDKLALIGWERDGRICCLALMRAEELNGVVRDVLGPLMRETPGS